MATDIGPGHRPAPRDVVVRDFRTGDQDIARRLIQDGLRSRWGPSFDPRANPDTDDLHRSYVAGGDEILVAELGGQVVAVGILCREPTPSFLAAGFGESTIPRLRRISVSDDHRRRGLGRVVVENLVGRAAGNGAAAVLVSTDTPWTDAIALYRSCGFTEVHRDDEETHLLRVI